VSYSEFDFSVAGGHAHAGRWGDPTDEVLVGVHGVTANHLNFALLGPALEGRASLVAPDVRGRGRSGGLPGPYGMQAYVDDLVSLADHLGIERLKLVGHSMGAYIAASYAALRPDRVESVFLIDGALTLPLPEGFDIDGYMKNLLGPSLERLRMTFDSPEAYRGYWRDHPALKEDWGDHVEAYIAYDLVPAEGGGYRSSVSEEAVTEYSVELLTSERGSDFKRIQCPAALVRAARGLLNQGTPLLPDALADALLAGTQITDLGIVPDTNHWTILFAPKHAANIADLVEKHLLGG
jgi:pimeloyl-ACP methyl ester carboxylesterase